MSITMISDLIDPDDQKGRSYREVNNSMKHKFEVGALVELCGGVRLFVAKQMRDCDGTPLYRLTPYKGHDAGVNNNMNGICEDDMTEIES